MKRLALLLTLLLVMATSVAHADNIWARRSERYGFLFVDNRARKVGDIVTLYVSESTAIGQREQRQMSKATAISDKFSFSGKTASDGGGRSGSASMDAANASNRTFSGSAQVQSNRAYTDRIGMTVVDVFPNGNVLLEGHRVRIIAGERRILRVTGIARPIDISPTNTVASETLANFRIEYVGRGTDSDFVNQGWFGRFFNIIWPF